MHHTASSRPWRARALLVLPALAAAALVVTLVGCAGAASTTATANAIGVNALTADPSAFTGEIVIEGVVQDVAPDLTGVALIDVTEYESCGLTPCGSAGVLPLIVPTDGRPGPGGASYTGTLPELEDRVVAVGTVRSGDSGLFFDVERIERGSSTLVEKQR